MAALTSILREIRGLNSDRSRDRLPEGAVWELTDWVPETMQAGARMRGRWVYQSDALANVPDGSIFAPFRAASKLLVAHGTVLSEIPTGSVGHTDQCTIPVTRQDPVFYTQTVVVPAANGTAPMRYITFSGTLPYGEANAPAGAPTARFAVPWRGRLVAANTNASPTGVWFSKPASIGGLNTWAPESFQGTSYDITGLASQTNQILVFHNGSVERIRGTEPPDNARTDVDGDLILDTLFDRAGCYDARSIAYWNTNVLFADARGIFLTDGAAVRNLCLQGTVMNLWMEMWERPKGIPPASVAGSIYRDYYICTVRHTGQPPITFIVEIPSRRVFMFTNIDATTFAASLGQRERIYAADAATKRMIDMSAVFDPDPSVLQIDEDGTPVLPVLATGWNRMSKNEGFKRVIDLHVSYEAHRDTDDEVLRVGYVRDPAYTGPQTLREFKTANVRARKRMSVNRRLEGVGVRLEQLLPTKDTRLYDISVRAYPEEETHL